MSLVDKFGRKSLLLVGFIGMTFAMALFAIPESPRWLVKRGDIERARSIFTRVGGSGHAEVELREVVTTISHEKGSVMQLFRPGLRRPMIIAVLLALFAHITGIDIIIYYGPTIFLEAGIGQASDALFASVVIGIVNLIFTIIGMSLVDKFGRKSLLLVGFIGMTFAMALFGFVFTSDSVGGIWMVIPALLFTASFCLSVGVVIWVYTSEIFPTKIRGSAMSIATMVLWLGNVLIAQAFQVMMEAIGGNVFYVLSALSAISFVFVLAMLPETKGRTLEDIETMWGA